jgi:hypothetical protein
MKTWPHAAEVKVHVLILTALQDELEAVLALGEMGARGGPSSGMDRVFDGIAAPS